METTLIYFIIIALLSLLVILKSASYAITAIAHYARKTGISDYIIGFLVISIGTSFPELTTGITQGTSDDNKFKWRVEVAPHPTDALGNNLPFSAYKVKVDVTWPGRLTEKGVILETLKTVVSKQ